MFDLLSIYMCCHFNIACLFDNSAEPMTIASIFAFCFQGRV